MTPEQAAAFEDGKAFAATTNGQDRLKRKQRLFKEWKQNEFASYFVLGCSHEERDSIGHGDEDSVGSMNEEGALLDREDQQGGCFGFRFRWPSVLSFRKSKDDVITDKKSVLKELLIMERKHPMSANIVEKEVEGGAENDFRQWWNGTFSQYDIYQSMLLLKEEDIDSYLEDFEEIMLQAKGQSNGKEEACKRIKDKAFREHPFSYVGTKAVIHFMEAVCYKL